MGWLFEKRSKFGLGDIKREDPSERVSEAFSGVRQVFSIVNWQAFFIGSRMFLCGVSPLQTSPFCFGKRDQNHFLRVRGPPGPSASAPNKMAQELALLKQPSPKRPIRDESSAAPNAGRNCEKENIR